MSSFRSSAISTVITAAGLAGLVAFAMYPAPTFAALWLTAELRALRQRPQDDFRAFELSPFDAARLEKTYEEAADVIQMLSDLEAGRAVHPDAESAADALMDRYRALRVRISTLRQMPIRSLRRWSGARAAASATRLAAVAIPLLALPLLLWKPLGGDPYRAVSAAAAAATLCLPPLYLIRRRRLETALGDREMFLLRWRPDDDDFLEFYLARSERAESAQAEPPDPEPADPKPAADTMPSAAAGRPKRPWFEVLQVDPDADESTIHKAYRARIKEYHPDPLHGRGPELKALAEAITTEINAAYEEAGRAR